MFRTLSVAVAVASLIADPSFAETPRMVSPEVAARLDELSGHDNPTPVVVLTDSADCADLDCAAMQPFSSGPPRRAIPHPGAIAPTAAKADLKGADS